MGRAATILFVHFMEDVTPTSIASILVSRVTKLVIAIIASNNMVTRAIGATIIVQGRPASRVQRRNFRDSDEF